jgi:hypothetical protein
MLKVMFISSAFEAHTREFGIIPLCFVRNTGQAEAGAITRAGPTGGVSSYIPGAAVVDPSSVNSQEYLQRF